MDEAHVPAQPDPFDPDETFDPRQRAMHGLLRVYFEPNSGDTQRRIAPVLSAMAAERAQRWRRQTVALCAAAIVVVVGAGATWRALRPAPPMSIPPLADAGQDTGLGPVRLASGENRVLTLAKGGTMWIQGPADLEFIDAAQARLRRGSIRVRVDSKRDGGFAVETPRGRVTDRGTEFGVGVGDDDATSVLVFEGKVDLAVSPSKNAPSPRVERLVQGEGVVVNPVGQLERVMAVVIGEDNGFQLAGGSAGKRWTRIIADVWDNIYISESRQFYEIVPGGLKEDAVAYVDRPIHEWNGMDAGGMPGYLLGADYVRTFNRDKIRRDMEISVRLTQPARLYVFLDRRVQPIPDWLPERFTDTGDVIGMDNGPWSEPGKTFNYEHGVGPGASIDQVHSVWERAVEQPGVIRLGPNLGGSWGTNMYGIAAVGLGSKAPAQTGPAADRPKENRP